MNFRKYLVGLAASAMVLGAASGANALTYALTTGALGNGNFGTVDVTGTSTDLHFVIDVAPNQIVDTGGHFSVAMNLSGSGFAYVGPAGFTLSTGTISNSPFSGFNIGVNCTTACGPGGSGPYGTSFTFDITGIGLGVLAANNFIDSNQVSHTINFAVDVLAPPTGVVGGGLAGGVPEPATWGLMILGFGGVGATIRRRRQVAAFA